MTGYPHRVGETTAQQDNIKGVLDGSAVATVDATVFKIGGTFVTATAAELNLSNGQIATAVPVLTAGAATDEMDITITVADAAGATIAAAHHLEVWISDSTTTKTLTATAASGALTAVDGAVLSVLTAKKHITCVTPVTGIINLSLVDSANTAGEVVYVKLPNGLTSQSAASVSGSYEGG